MTSNLPNRFADQKEFFLTSAIHSVRDIKNGVHALSVSLCGVCGAIDSEAIKRTHSAE